MIFRRHTFISSARSSNSFVTLVDDALPAVDFDVFVDKRKRFNDSLTEFRQFVPMRVFRRLVIFHFLKILIVGGAKKDFVEAESDMGFIALHADFRARICATIESFFRDRYKRKVKRRGDNRIRSLNRTRWGDVKTCVSKPAASAIARIKAVVDPLPFVPAT